MDDRVATTQIIDCMTPFLVTAGRYDSLAVAYEKMMTNHIRRLPVTEHDRLIGIISMSDILRFKPPEIRRYLSFAELSKSLDTVNVDMVMAPEPIVVYQSDQVGYAAELMLDKKIGGLPVFDARDALVGLVTESDIFRLLVRQWREINAENH